MLALKKWDKKCNKTVIQFKEESVSTLPFADDQAVIAENADDIVYTTRPLMKDVNADNSRLKSLSGIDLQVEA